MPYSGSYFDGKSATVFTAEVEVVETGLNVNYWKDINGSPTDCRSAFWEHQLIHSTDITGSKSILKYGADFPYQTLEITSSEFLQEVTQKQPAAPYLNNYFRKFSATGNRGVFVAVSLVMVACLALYFYCIPAFMVAAATVFPISVEVDLGNEMKNALLREEQVDSAGTLLINNFYGQLKNNSAYNIHITLVKSRVKNAYALPGGNIIVFTGILNDMQSYEELAALLGHETGHIHYRHTLKMLFKSLSNYIILSAIFQDVSGAFAVIVDHSSSIERLSYSRKIESESDDFGYALMTSNRINPQGMVDLFTHLEKEDSNNYLPQFLSTHPELTDRIKVTKRKIKLHPVQHIPHPHLAALFVQIQHHCKL